MVRLPARSFLFARRLLLLAALVAFPSGGAQAALCPVPQLTAPEGTGDTESIALSREALARYESCLNEQAGVLELLNPDAAQKLTLQRDAAAQLKRTLDAWIKARLAADARRPL